jgi:hypothetical protein
MAQGLNQEEIDEVKERLQDGESARSIADDMGVTHPTILNYKEEMKEEMELEERVRASSGPTIEDVREAADSVPGIGEATLDTMEEMADTRPLILEDPDELYKYINRLTDLEHDWIDHIVRATYPHLDDPGQSPNQPQQRTEYYGAHSGGQQQSPSYSGGRQGPPQQQGGGQQGPNSQVEQRVEQLASTVEDLAETVQQSQEPDDAGQMVEVEMEDGRTIRAPPHSPLVQQGLDTGSDDDDFIEKIKKAQEMGVLPKPDETPDEGEDDILSLVEKLEKLGLLEDDTEGMAEVMSEQFSEAIDQVAKTQEMTAKQISSAMEEIAKQQAQTDDDDSLTRDEVEEILQEKEEEDKLERLERKLDERTRQLEEQVTSRQRPQPSPENNPELVETEREYDFKEQQMETMNQNVRLMLEELPTAIREGVVPAVKALDDSSLANGSPFWSQPTGEQRGPPQVNPPQQPQARQPQQQQAEAPPETGVPADPEEPDTPSVDEPETADELDDEYVSQVRDNLNLGDDTDEPQAEA